MRPEELAYYVLILASPLITWLAFDMPWRRTRKPRRLVAVQCLNDGSMMRRSYNSPAWGCSCCHQLVLDKDLELSTTAVEVSE